jgi:hypothetical protein
LSRIRHRDSISEPTCNTAGCFAGLISIVANDIPELKKLYTDTAYNYHSWIIAFYRFLETDLTTWAMMNQKKWRNSLGIYMFRSGIAFGKAKDDKLTHNMIIIHLRKVTTMTTVWDCWVSYVKPAIF